MNSYDNRTKPATYTPISEYAKNSYILAWWTFDHDQVIERKIEEWIWYWADDVVDSLVAIQQGYLEEAPLSLLMYLLPRFLSSLHLFFREI